MHASSKIGTCLVVFVVWVVYSRLIILFWGYYPSINPILDWATGALIPDKRFLFYALIYTHDLLVNVLLALPVGYLFRRYTQANLWGTVITTITLIFLWDYRLVFWGEASIIDFFSHFGAMVGVITTVCLLPFVYYLAGKWDGKYAT